MARRDETFEDMPTTEIVGVNIDSYKNLDSVWLDWSSALVLVGGNGAGKSNLLECLALLMGNPMTRTLVAKRVPGEQPFDISAVVTEVKSVMLLSPELCVPLVKNRTEGLEPTPPRSDSSLIDELSRDGQWWVNAGWRAGDSMVDAALRQLDEGAKADVASLIESAFAAGKVRYRLSRTAEKGASAEDRADTGQRRTLVVARGVAKPYRAKVRAVADRLPPMFAPLKEWANSRTSSTNQDRWVDVLVLPARTAAVADLQWLPRERTDEEILDDFVQAVEAAERGGLEHLGDQLSAFLRQLKLNPGDPDLTLEVDLEWWAHELAQDLLKSELAWTMPHLSVGAQLGSFDISSNGTFVGELEANGAGALQRLSAGERRWMDEALASASHGLRRRAIDGMDEARAIADLDENEVIAALQGVQDHLEAEWRSHGYIGEAVLQPALEIISTMSVARRAWAESQLQELSHLAASSVAEPATLNGEDWEVLTRMLRHGVRLRPRPIRVFDEPEAHLHPRSLLTVVAALNAMRHRSDVIVATHSPRLLQQPGWDHYRLTRRKGVTRLSRYDATDQSQVSQIARELGITGGELLVNTSGILFVEGRHDQLILETFFAEDLEIAGVRIIPFRGTGNVMSIATMELVANLFTDLTVGVMVDNHRKSPPKPGAPGWRAEERDVDQLMKALAAQGRQARLVPLAEPDVIAYLAEPAVRRAFPNFSSWDLVVAQYRQVGGRNFKNWLAEQSSLRIRLRTEREIQTVVDAMVGAGDPPKPGLAAAVKEFCAFVTDRSDDERPPQAQEMA